MERREIEAHPEAEHTELKDVYIQRGLEAPLADRVARQLMAHDALGARVARDELGMSEITAARPLQAALASAASFAVGAAVPLVVVLLASRSAVMAGVDQRAVVADGARRLVGQGRRGARVQVRGSGHGLGRDRHGRDVGRRAVVRRGSLGPVDTASERRVGDRKSCPARREPPALGVTRPGLATPSGAPGRSLMGGPTLRLRDKRPENQRHDGNPALSHAGAE